MRTAKITVDFPAAVAAIAAELGATCHDRAPHRHPNNAPPETYRRFLALPSGIVVEAHWYGPEYARGEPWIDFSWCNWPMDGNTQITPSQCETRDSGPAPDCHTRANGARPAASVAKQVQRAVVEPAVAWLPHMHAFIAKRQEAEAAALEAAREIAATFGSRFDPERDRRGPAMYHVWLGLDTPFGACSVNGYGRNNVSIYPERSSNLTVKQLVAMIGAYRAHMEASHD